MATRIRLRRMGAKKRPFYRVVVADQRAPRDGRFIENIGKYHPLEDPSLIEIDEERALHWLRVGAQPSSQVRNLMVKIGIWDRFVEERPAAADLVRKRTEKPERRQAVEEGRGQGRRRGRCAAGPRRRGSARRVRLPKRRLPSRQMPSRMTLLPPTRRPRPPRTPWSPPRRSPPPSPPRRSPPPRRRRPRREGARGVPGA